MRAKPIVRWPGGKRRLAKTILPMFPEHGCYVEPFAGGAALFFMKTPSDVEVLNDINGDLVNLYRVVQHHLDEFVRQFRWGLMSRQAFLWHREAKVETLTDIQRAARFFYLQKMSFGGRVVGQKFGTATIAPPRINRLRIEEDLSNAHMRLARTIVENLPWEQCIARYDRPRTLFYLDPPYWGTEGYGVEFGLENYTRMAELAKGCQGKMIISVNDIPEMQEAFKGLNISTVETTYTIGGAGRSLKARELVIRNF